MGEITISSGSQVLSNQSRPQKDQDKGGRTGVFMDGEMKE
jgi:hypothetical protein